MNCIQTQSTAFSSFEPYQHSGLEMMFTELVLQPAVLPEWEKLNKCIGANINKTKLSYGIQLSPSFVSFIH